MQFMIMHLGVKSKHNSTLKRCGFRSNILFRTKIRTCIQRWLLFDSWTCEISTTFKHAITFSQSLSTLITIHIIHAGKMMIQW